MFCPHGIFTRGQAQTKENKGWEKSKEQISNIFSGSDGVKAVRRTSLGFGLKSENCFKHLFNGLKRKQQKGKGNTNHLA